ncbi:NAD(P)/FAD-dependent oxidoreductase [Phaeovulum sp.]|uniref:NAD(P)/FAD-dependent oxidoreductase n=1 Tax=Phaeovulum sp. TaxID=2934796 RepID=UPI00272FD80B|nr:NAD(P)/FAD-dependent oxidoreductase [Phaeovulum sp.]MDP1670425.1 NAD(P)/FAD-dependent oxidoreductase [Phaeovulum sp.]MDZ4120628.1 NAD(P)/FAD-dependent oxidoreductase [Phaeovulum sp.]
MAMHRRHFIGAAFAGAALISAPMLRAQGRPRVVVVGGGAGGATVARYLAKDSAGALDVVLVEPNRVYRSCFFSNLALADLRSPASLEHRYDRLAADYGITVLHDRAVAVDRARREVSLGAGGLLAYDKLVLAPGIDFVPGSVAGWSEADAEVFPHAYRGGAQVDLLRAQLGAMRQGGTFALVAPPNPYRCPPGPYERVSMVASLLGRINPTAKILLLDPKATFSKQALFEEGWARHYPGVVERIGPDAGGAAVEVRPAAGEIVVAGAVVRVDVCNVIPAQRAGAIAEAAGLTEAGWVPVEPLALASKADPAVHVLGDSAAQGDMPKSGFSANSQAKVVANAIRAALTGSRAFPPRYTNTCWSAIAPGDGVKVGASYTAGEGKIATGEGFISQVGETAELRAATYAESFAWYDAISEDIFG